MAKKLLTRKTTPDPASQLTVPNLTSEQVAALLNVVQYNWEDEQTDYNNQDSSGKRAHIYKDLQTLAELLDHARSSSGKLPAVDPLQQALDSKGCGKHRTRTLRQIVQVDLAWLHWLGRKMKSDGDSTKTPMALNVLLVCRHFPLGLDDQFEREMKKPVHPFKETDGDQQGIDVDVKRAGSKAESAGPAGSAPATVSSDEVSQLHHGPVQAEDSAPAMDAGTSNKHEG
jgi:hypothetical protein